MENQSFYKNLLEEFTFVKENMSCSRNNNSGNSNTAKNKFITDEDRNNKLNENLKQV